MFKPLIMEVAKEGTLLKWTNYLYGWKKRYFVLHDNLLEYCKQKGNPLKGKMSLSTLSVKKHPKKDSELILDTGVKTLSLKAQNPKEAQEWFVALKRALTLDASPNIRLANAAYKTSVEDKVPLSRPLASKVAELWSIHALISESIDSIPQSIRTKCPDLEKTVSLCNTFKMLSSEALSLIEAEENKPAFPSAARRSVDFSDTNSLVSPKNNERLSIVAEDCKSDESVQFEDAHSHCSNENEHYMQHRSSLPYLRNPNQKYNIWRVVKDSVGKELSKIAVPVYFNEPISFLQRFTEDLTYHEVVLNACEIEDPLLRLAYVAGFGVTSYVSTQQRTMKPFNPLLGETFELIRDGYRIISEQVSHHPPISAMHCEHNKFSFFASIEIKSSFKGTHLNVKPTGTYNLIIKEFGDHFQWTKPQTNVHNIIFGKMYVDHYGKMEFVNKSTGDRAELNFHKKGWFEKVSHEVTGTVLDKYGNVRYKLIGEWNNSMSVIDVHTNKAIVVWEKYPYPQGYDHNYFFSDFAIQLNLPPELFPGLPGTDSRRRPDQRALENGDIKLAGTEKNRLEVKQRESRKEREDTGQLYFPRWFHEQEGGWVYSGGYWECKEQDCFKDLPDIF